jgi:hypothetical protein
MATKKSSLLNASVDTVNQAKLALGMCSDSVTTSSFLVFLRGCEPNVAEFDANMVCGRVVAGGYSLRI